MTGFKTGQRVKVEFEGEIRNPRDTTNRIMIVTDPGWMLHVPRESESGVKVTLADPQNWPPQVGDIWEVDGIEWFCRVAEVGPETLVLVADRYRPARSLDDLKALNPVLVRRRGQ